MTTRNCSNCNKNAGPDCGGRDPDLCTDCYWKKNGAAVKLIWNKDGKELVETREGLTPDDVVKLQKLEGKVCRPQDMVLVYVRIEHPGHHEIS